MALDINGYSLAKGTDFTIGGTGTKIDSGGRIVIPANTNVSGTNLTSGTAARQNPQVINTMTVNSGAWTGNTTFTAPVAGLYFISSAMIVNSTGDNTTATNTQTTYFGVLKNGGIHSFGYVNTADGWTPVMHQTMAYLAVGDQITIAINASPLTVGTGAGYYQNNHGNLVITLIG